MEVLEQARTADPVTTAALRSFVQKVSARSDFAAVAPLAIRANTGIVVAVDGRTVILTAADLIKVREKETPHH